MEERLLICKKLTEIFQWFFHGVFMPLQGSQRQNSGGFGFKTIGLIAGFVILVIIGLGFVFGCYTIVQPNQMAGERIMGSVVSKVPLQPGFHWKIPFVEDVDKINVSTTVFTLPAMEVHTADNQIVHIGFTITYKIPSSAVLNLLYHTGGIGSVDIANTMAPTIRSRALGVFAQHNTLNISLHWQTIANQMFMAVKDALRTKYGIDVLGLQISKIGYSREFTDAVENAVKAKAAAVQAQNEVERRKYEAEQAVIEAKGKAEAQIAEAKGNAESSILTATGHAKSIEIDAAAQSKAIQEIGSAVTSNPKIVSYNAIKQWNGALPHTVLGANGPSGLILNSNK